MNRLLVLALVLGLAACSSGPEPDPRVAFAPTSAFDMPPAIVGNGGPLEGQSVRYFDADTASVGYLAVPEGDGPFPALVIIHEWNGLVDRVRQVADEAT